MLQRAQLPEVIYRREANNALRLPATSAALRRLSPHRPRRGETLPGQFLSHPPLSVEAHKPSHGGVPVKVRLSLSLSLPAMAKARCKQLIQHTQPDSFSPPQYTPGARQAKPDQHSLLFPFTKPIRIRVVEIYSSTMKVVGGGSFPGIGGSLFAHFPKVAGVSPSP